MLRFESRHLCMQYYLACGINSKSSEMKSNIMPKNDNNNAKIVFYYCSIFINKFKQVEHPALFVSWSLNRCMFIYKNLMFDH